MACSYNYKGIEFSRRDLLSFIQQESGAIESTTSPNKMMYEVSGEVGKAQAKQQARLNYGTDEFLSFHRNGEKLYMTIDERLFNEQVGTKRLVYNEQKELVEVDIDEQIEKYNKGQLKNPTPSLYDAIQARLSDRIIHKAKEQLATKQGEPKEDLITILTAFVNGMGITVTTMEDYKRSYSERNGTPATVSALADMLNRVIALSNEGNVEDFAEEVGHFVAEYYNNQEVLTPILAKINQTTTYQRYSEQYRQVYSKDYSGEALEQKVRMEVLGKLFGEAFINNYNTENKGLNETGIINKLKQLFQQFLDLFKKTDSNKAFFSAYGRVLDNIANEVTSGNYQNFSPTESKEVYYSLDKEGQSLDDNLKRIKQELANKYKLIHSSAKSTIRDRKNRLAAIADSLVNLDYLDTIHSYVGALRADMRNAQNIINNADKAVEDMIEKRRALDGAAFVEPTPQEEREMLIQALGEVNIVNLSVFNAGIERSIKELRSDLEYVEKNTRASDNIKKEHINAVRKSLEALVNIQTIVTPRTVAIQRDISHDILKKAYMKEGVPEAEATRIANTILTNNLKDVNIVSKFLMGFQAYGNAITQIIYSSIRKADTYTRIQTRAFQERLAKKAEQLKITKDLSKKLMDKDMYMIDEYFHGDADKYYEDGIAKLMEKKVEALESAKTEAERIAIEVQFKEDKEKFDKETLVSKFTTEFSNKLTNRTGKFVDINGDQFYVEVENPITKSPFRSKAAQEIIMDLSRDTSKILGKYKNPKGEIDFSKISPADQSRLQEVASERARAMSLYNEDMDGSLKSPAMLAVALDVADYYQGGGTEISQAAKDRFKQERQRAKDTLSTSDFKRWEEFFSYQKYSEKDLPAGELNRVVDVEATQINATINKKLHQEIKQSVYIPNLKGAEPNFQQLYDALRTKREYLLKPYKKARNSSEIDGVMVEADSGLVEALSTIDMQMRFFKIQEASDRDFRKSPNEAFKKQYRKLKRKSAKALSDWLKVNTEKNSKGEYEYYTETDPVTGEKTQYPIPSTRYYIKYELLNEDGTLVEKERVPTMYWEMLVSDKNNKNPEYNPRLDGKARQYNKTIRDKYKNQEFYNLFNPTSEGIPTTNQNLFALRTFLLEEKSNMDNGISSLSNSYWILPQVRPHGMEALTSLKKAKSAAANLVVVDNYEEDFNTDRGGFANKRQEGSFVPLHFHMRSEDPSMLSTDLSHIYTNYAAMSNNYREKTKIMMDMELLKNTMRESTTAGEGTRIFKSTEEFLSANLYGNKFVELAEGQVMGKTVSVTKVVNTLNRGLSSKNLGLNSKASITGGISAVIQADIMAAEGTYFTRQGDALADKLMNPLKGLGAIMSDIGSPRPKTYLGKLEFFSGTTGVEEDFAKGLFASNRLERTVTQSNPLFDLGLFTAFGKYVGLKTTIKVYDNFRLVDGDFITFRNFEERIFSQDRTLTRKQTLEQWKQYQDQSYLNFLKEEEQGIVIDTDKLDRVGFKGDPLELKARVDIATKTANDMVEGQAQGIDKTVASRNPLVQFLFFMHRGFFQRFTERAFKQRQMNSIIGAYEEGTYITFGRVWKKAVQELSVQEQLQLALGYFAPFAFHDKVMTKLGLDSLEVMNTRRVRQDLHKFLVAFGIFVLFNLLADDDDNEDDFLIQYSALIASRVFNETSSVQLPFGATDILSIFESPSSGFGFLRDLTEIPKLVVDWNDEITKGSYEGLTKGEKKLIQYTPFKNVLEPLWGGTRESNAFFRKKTLGVSNSLYEKVSDTVYE